MTRLLLVLCGVLLCVPAFGQTRPGRRREPPTVVLPTQVLYGQIHHPAAALVLQRSRPRIEPTPLDTTFVREVTESVKSGPF